MSNTKGTVLNSVDTARNVPSQLRILWLKTELLHPVDKGGKIRTIEMLRRLKTAHHITYLTLDDGAASQQNRDDAREYCHELVTIPFRAAARNSTRFYLELLANVPSRLPYALARYRSRAMQDAVASMARSGQHDIVVSDFLVQAVNVPDDLPLPSVLFQHNVEAMIWQRHAQVHRNPLAKLYFGDQWRRMVAFEARACRRFDRIIAVSEDDSAIMRRDYGIATVSAVPTGVDTDYFRPSGKVTATPRSLVFTGSMDWMPNDDAIRYFMAEIMPKVRCQEPEATLTVVGRDPSAALRNLAASQPGLIVTGRVPDVRPYIEAADCFIVPMRIGGGTRLKIFEAMAMEKPVVSTTVGAEGLPVADGRDILLADAPEAFAAAVVSLLRDQSLAQRIGGQAASTVRERFGWARVADQFTALLHEAMAAHGGGLGAEGTHAYPYSHNH